MVRAALSKRQISIAVPIRGTKGSRKLSRQAQAEVLVELAGNFKVMVSYERESWTNIANGYRYLLAPNEKAKGRS